MNELSVWIFGIIGSIITASIARLFVQVKKTNDETITLKTEVRNLKENQNHDKVIKIEAEVDQLKEDVSEIKHMLKLLLEKN